MREKVFMIKPLKAYIFAMNTKNSAPCQVELMLDIRNFDIDRQ